MQVVPLLPVPSQTLSISLFNQTCQIDLRQLAYGLFMDLYVDNALVIGGVICQNLNRIVRSLYLGFQGDFMFLDNQGSSDPQFAGLGTRYSLIYLAPSDLPAGVG